MNKSAKTNIRMLLLRWLEWRTLMKNKKMNLFISGIIALMFSQVVVKLLGMIYSLYLTNKDGFGDNGNAIYTSSFQIYAIFLTISSIGIPNAISKLVAEDLSIGDVNGAKRIFKVSIAIFSVVGFACSLILYLFSDLISIYILEDEVAADILKILAPSIFFVSISSVIRGYFNGKQNTKVSAATLSFEQLIKTLLTVVMVEFISRKTSYNTVIMVKFATMATSSATILSFVYVFIKYIIAENKDSLEVKLGISRLKKTTGQIFKEIIFIAIPLIIASFINVLEKNIDSITIIKLLKNKIGEDLAREKYGILSSKVGILTNFPMSLNGAISIVLIPEIAKLSKLNSKGELKKKINFSFWITIFICVPIMVGMFYYSDEIINLLFPNANKGGELLKLSSLSIIFTALTQNMVGILQGLGQMVSYLKIISFSLIFKLILNLVLIPLDGILEKGAIVSTIVYNIIVFILMLIKIKKTTNVKLDMFMDILKTFVITVVSIIIAKNLIMIFVNNISINSNLKFLIEILSVAIIYIIVGAFIYHNTLKEQIGLEYNSF